METLKISFLLLFISHLSFGQNSKDLESIKKMCGCYAVDFRYAETFSDDSSYQKHDNYRAKANAEWIFVEEESPNRIVLQHLLIVNDTVVIKHWRQDWLYENTVLFDYQPNKVWNKKQLDLDEVKGTWTQVVYQVDDSPRYSGKATWVHRDGLSYWESKCNAPLPRREFSKRNDYNLMKRKNRHEIKEWGWLHEQDNLKINQTENVSKVLVEEKGRNTYTKLEDSACKIAQIWWDKNSDYWRIVRSEWDRALNSTDRIQLASEVNNQKLHQALFGLGKEQLSQDIDDDKLKLRIRKIIEDFREENPSN